MSTYEIVAVVRPDLDEEGLGAAIDRINQRITEHGGSVKSTDRWGKRKTAYPIKKYRDGYYVLTVFSLDAGQVARLRQTLGLHEDLLRFTVTTHHGMPVAAAAPGPVAGPTPAASSAPAASSPPASDTAPAPALPAPPKPASASGPLPAAAAEDRPAGSPEDTHV